MTSSIFGLIVHWQNGKSKIINLKKFSKIIRFFSVMINRLEYSKQTLHREERLLSQIPCQKDYSMALLQMFESQNSFLKLLAIESPWESYFTAVENYLFSNQQQNIPTNPICRLSQCKYCQNLKQMDRFNFGAFKIRMLTWKISKLILDEIESYTK